MSKIFVTQPFLPPLKEFVPYLEKIWDNKWLTNSGPFHQELESALTEYLKVKNLALFTNGTIALVTALQALRITGEVITTPYSFVATAHSLMWNGIKPVFVDIDPFTCNLDTEKIEQAITPRTSAILPVHCYGNPCKVERIQEISDVYGLKVIYDAAHAFGISYKGESLLNYGDLSILSFHATKVFNTFEGGAIICPDAKTKQRIDYLKNFGFADEVTVVAPGINGKMNEIQAAFGLLHLKYADEAIEKRMNIDRIYREEFRDIKGVSLFPQSKEASINGSYFPLIIEPEYPLSRDQLYENMKNNGIFSRRYFYPLISSFPMYRGLPSASPVNLPVATRIAEKVLCLPIHPNLSEEDVFRVVSVIKRAA